MHGVNITKLKIFILVNLFILKFSYTCELAQEQATLLNTQWGIQYYYRGNIEKTIEFLDYPFNLMLTDKKIAIQSYLILGQCYTNINFKNIERAKFFFKLIIEANRIYNAQNKTEILTPEENCHAAYYLSKILYKEYILNLKEKSVEKKYLLTDLHKLASILISSSYSNLKEYKYGKNILKKLPSLKKRKYIDLY